MKIYQLSRPYLWLRGGTKTLATAAAVFLYISAVTHPTPLSTRLALLAGLTAFGYLMYVRQPRMPSEIIWGDDGSIEFRGRKGTQRLHVADLRSIAPGTGRMTVRVRHKGGRLRMPNRFHGFYDFLATVKAHNPSVAIKGF
ncbi:MAG: hypothetical protein JWN86_3006 [Planctomycetota bacterium]|nr:hypothetical protein [Planctomycetota bacterium]